MMKMKAVKILLVEDNEDHAELVRIALDGKRLVEDFIHRKDGEEALDFLFEETDEYERPDLILLDLRLPKVDGLEVLKELKTNSKTRKIPTVILTTSNNEIDIARAYDYHANSYLVKPLDYRKLKQLINNLGEYWLEMNEKPKETGG